MARRRDPLYDQLESLKLAAESSSDQDLTDHVRAALSSKHSILIEQAAKLIRERDLSVEPQVLVAAYERLLVTKDTPDKAIEDTGCRAKVPLIEALHDLEYDEPEFYSNGLLYQQWEPAWADGAPIREDTAGHLRGAHAYALVSSQLASPHETLMKLTELLYDRTRVAQEHAAAAIGQLGHPGSAAVLKCVALQRSAHPDVVANCFRGLLRNDRTVVPFVATYLSSHDLAIEAAEALCEFGSDEAVKAVIDTIQDGMTSDHEALSLTLGTSRNAMAVDFLVEQVSKGESVAELAIESLAPKRFYPDITDRVREAVEFTGDRNLQRLFNETFFP